MSDDRQRGLYSKYDVYHAGTDQKVPDCFVLRPDRDEAAQRALAEYAAATPNLNLARDIWEWLERIGAFD